MNRIGVIGGTGLSDLEGLQGHTRKDVSTPFGPPSAPVVCGETDEHEVFFIARHGSDHTIPPHKVNYRANIWSFRHLEVTRIVAINSVGGISPALSAGCLVVPDQIVDYTWGRHHTYFETSSDPVVHADFTVPYSEQVRRSLLDAGRVAGLDVHDGGTYGVTQGPRLETSAEIDRMDRDGCDMVGMTGMPETSLARELDLEYACCAVVINRAAGRGEGIHGEIEKYLADGMRQVRRLLAALL